MLAKSNDLSKSALEIYQHYLELQLFLKIIKEDLNTVMNKSYKVFPFEDCLFGTNFSVNHCKDVPVHARLFQPDDWNGTIVYPLVVAGAIKMNQKLSEYPTRGKVPRTRTCCQSCPEKPETN